MMKKIVILSVIFCLGLFCSAQAGDSSHWYSNYDQALRKASQTNKPIYLLFVNSHSCPRCRHFEKSFLPNEEFIRYAKEKLILLKVDYGPHYKSNKKISISEIEKAGDIPKHLWMKGRGPWPHLFLISPSEKIIYSGSAFGKSRNPDKYVSFLKKNLD